MKVIGLFSRQTTAPAILSALIAGKPNAPSNRMAAMMATCLYTLDQDQESSCVRLRCD
jgi:hypothetical protein